MPYTHRGPCTFCIQSLFYLISFPSIRFQIKIHRNVLKQNHKMAHRLEPWYSFVILFYYSNRKLIERKSTHTIAIVSVLNISSLSIFLNNLNKMNQRSSSYIHARVKQVRIMKQKRRGWQIYKFQTGIQTALSTTKSLFFADTIYRRGVAKPRIRPFEM